MTAKSQRLLLVFASAIVLGLAAWLVSTALRDNIVFFFTPSEVSTQHYEAKRLRIGGLVESESLIIDGLTANFIITDETANISVQYKGALPDLFREGQGVVAEGRFENKRFIADIVLAKHDETYMPREIADKLKEQGVWQGGTDAEKPYSAKIGD